MKMMDMPCLASASQSSVDGAYYGAKNPPMFSESGIAVSFALSVPLLTVAFLKKKSSLF